MFVDGNFGLKTQDAVLSFQKQKNLVADGVVGSATWNVLLPVIIECESRSLNNNIFFGLIRESLFKNGFSQSQVDGINCILGSFQARKIPLNYASYMLATAYHETACTMQPIEEYGRGRGRVYGKRFKMNREPYSPLLPIYYGRGYVQLTWYENYEKAGKQLGIDLLRQPELALVPFNASEIMIYGMLGGWFTGKKLSDYITHTTANYLNARRIINGLDKAGKIATEAICFETALRRAKS